MPIRPTLLLNSAKMAEEVFITKNKFNTKEPSSRRDYSILMRDTIVFQDTFDDDYVAKRKSVSAAFFKKKLRYMTELFKKNIFEEFRGW